MSIEASFDKLPRRLFLDTPDLDPRLRSPDGSVRRLGLTPEEVSALIAFLESLTDSTFLTAKKFSDPFPCHAGSASSRAP